MKVSIKCQECGKDFLVIPYRAKTGRAKYCSLECKYKNMDYKKKKGEVRSCQNCSKEYYLFPTRVRKGANKFCSVKCRAVFNIGKFIGKNSFNWKGDNAGYQARHRWLYKNVKKPDSCPVCNEKKPLDWANLDHKYSRDIKSWKPMCKKCHYKYDIEHGFRKKTKKL